MRSWAIFVFGIAVFFVRDLKDLAVNRDAATDDPQHRENGHEDSPGSDPLVQVETEKKTKQDAIKDEKEVSDLDIAIMAFDEEFDITRQESLNETLLAGCKLGKYSELIKYAKEKNKEFPGLISGLKTYIELPGDFYERLRRKEPVLAKLIGEVHSLAPLNSKALM